MRKVNGDYFYNILFRRFCIGHECRECELYRDRKCMLREYDILNRTKDLSKVYEKFYGNILVE